MPKADSPVKPRRRGRKLHLTGFFPVKASSSPAKSSGEREVCESSGSSRTAGLEGSIGLAAKGNDWWCPQDIFDPEKNPEDGLEEDISGDEGIQAEPLLDTATEEGLGEQVLVETLDEAAIAAQLVSSVEQKPYVCIG